MGNERMVAVPASALTRAKAFIRDFQHAPNDADIEIRVGRTEDGEPALLVSIGPKDHALTADEALTIANIFEEAMNHYPTHPDSATLPNIILGLRQGVAASRAALANPESSQ